MQPCVVDWQEELIDWDCPSAGSRSSTMTIEISRIQETCQRRGRSFSGEAHDFGRMNRQLAAPARALMPKKSPARTIRCAQHQRLTMIVPQLARGSGTTTREQPFMRVFPLFLGSA
jgi:hypothetical protein